MNKTLILIAAALLMSGCATTDPIKSECRQYTTVTSSEGVYCSGTGCYYRGRSTRVVEANYQKCLELGGLEAYVNSDYTKPRPGSPAAVGWKNPKQWLATCENVMGVGHKACARYALGAKYYRD